MVTYVTVYFVTIKEAMSERHIIGDFDLEQFLPFRLNRAAEFIALRFAAALRASYLYGSELEYRARPIECRTCPRTSGYQEKTV